MGQTRIEEQTFEKINFSTTTLTKADYDYCKFISCDFSSTNLSNFNFLECEFNDCNLSMVKLKNTAFKEVKFKNCKLLGLPFEQCNDFLFSVYFEHSILNLSSFYKCNLKKTIFKDSTLQEVDFTETDLTAASFSNCDLLNAVFDKSILEKVDFRNAYNYSIDPEKNRIKKAKFSNNGVVGLLHKYDIEIS